MQLLYGTYNPAKLDAMRRWLAALPITLVGLRELETLPPDAEETGATPLENARIKAIHYRDITGMTTLAADSALFIDGLAPEDQPSVHARRVQGERLDDEAMLRYYADIAGRLGGRAVARYRNALCIAFDDGHIVDICDDSVSSRPFYLLDTPHVRRTPGFPLDSLSAEIESGQYYYDMNISRADGDLAQENGYRRFVRDAMGLDA